MTPALSTVAEFPEHSFLENLAVRHDDSLLVTSLNAKQLWFVPAGGAAPFVLHTYDHLVTAVVETEPDVFHVALTDGYTTHESHLSRVDLRGWVPGETEPPIETVLTFDDRVRALNGACLVAPGVLLVADCFAGLIWRVDLPSGTADVWLAHASMAHDPLSTLKPPQPGVNGVRYAASTGHLYYTSTAQKLFMRVPVDPVTHTPAGAPEHVGGGSMADDFCLDEDAGVAYVTTHRENTIDRVPLDPGSAERPRTVLGDPLDLRLLGPSSMAWSRRRAGVAYVTTDGGTTAPPPDGRVRPAKVLRLELFEQTEALPHDQR
ncbi:hypothetical protein M8542_20050 [Amycolatopsis sp. OK19-0408]|uniref:Sugar lactone lactonase YvrE n=1 Tax=Amycolatopsis iheyensis TaxID=2945988 RepID=A0A9X2SLR1_9PSEU|nr:hypothetical protein [Amycolatopsis iheyensis]MCR6485126.1 hypothetical protein [Amycolatopsis iheyensis]